MKNTVQTFKEAKKNHMKLAMLTAYDYSTAKLQDEAGIHGILVGDSLGNVILGYEDTISVTMEDMIHHGAAVARGAKNAHRRNRYYDGTVRIFAVSVVITHTVNHRVIFG